MPGSPIQVSAGNFQQIVSTLQKEVEEDKKRTAHSIEEVKKIATLIIESNKGDKLARLEPVERIMSLLIIRENMSKEIMIALEALAQT